MELSWPLALVLALAVVPAWWLARRAGGRAAVHPLWFLVDPGATRMRRRRGRRARLLLVAAVALVALAAAGPRAIDDDGARVLVIDESATRVLDLAAVRARLAGFDEAVLIGPDRAPRRMTAAAAAAALAPSPGTVDAAALASAVDAALPRARSIEIAVAPPPGDDVAIAAVTFHRDALAPRRGRLVVELALHGDAAPPDAVVARAGAVERGRARPVRVGDRAHAVLPYDGDGDETLIIELEPRAADAIAIDDRASVRVPSLAPVPVWIDPALDGAPIARAVAVLPTVTRIAAPAPDAIAVVPTTAWRGLARARIVVITPPAGAPVEPLLAVSGSPLVGVTPALLAATAAVPIDPDAGRMADAGRVWLRAGRYPAIWLTDDRPTSPITVHVAAALDGAVVPIVLADALAAPPLAGAAVIDVADVRPPPRAPVLPRAPGERRRGWPTRVLLAAAALAVIAELLLTRARRAGLVVRLAALAALGATAWRAVEPPHRRVAFVLDVSDSVAPAAAAARAELARRAATLSSRDRAAVVIVGNGAALAVPPGPPDAVRAWAIGTPVDASTHGVATSSTDLAAGLALADRALGGPGGELVVIGDGRDSVRGAAAVRDAPALIGRGFELAPIESGDLVRLVSSVAVVRAMPARTVALPIELEARVALEAAITATHRGRVVGHRTIQVAAGRTRAVVDVVIDEPGPAELIIAVSAPGDRMNAGDRVRIQVEVGGAARTLRVDGSTAGAITNGALDGVDTVVLADVPGELLDAAAVATLDGFVSAGGTLLWAAGPAVATSGPGTLGRLLPLRGEDDRPTALLVVVDRSGSIDAAGHHVPVPGAAELAAAAAALAPGDWFGAIAFDRDASDWVAMTPVGPALEVPVLPPARGGTDPAPALILATRRLAATPAGARRIVVLVSDGGFAASTDRAVAAAAALARAGAHLEVIAVGSVDDDARGRLAAVATAGGGRVHDLPVGLAASLPALRAAPAIKGSFARARARAGWTTEVGAVPPPLVAGTPVRVELALSPTPDAVVLADAGVHPLLAVRRHGAGRVLAWSTDLDGAWIDVSVSDALVAALGHPRIALALEADEGSDRRTVDLRATGVGETPMLATVVTRQRSTPLMMVPATPGTLTARLPRPTISTVIELDGARLQLPVADAEHDHLGVDPEVLALRRPTHGSRSDAMWSLVPLSALALLAILGTALWLPER